MRITRSGASGGILLCVLLALASVADARQREKTDIVTLKNGDRITCAIVALQYGQLQARTSALGTVNIKWEEVATIQSSFVFEVELLGAARHYGAFSPSADGRHIVITSHEGTVELDPIEITRIAEIDSEFWKRIHGTMGLGYSFTQSSDVSTASAVLAAGYRAEKIAMNLDLSLQRTVSPEKGTQDRDKLAYTYQWLRPNRNFWAGLASLERNEELGIDGRLQLGAGFGRYLVRSPVSEFSAFGGLAVQQEWITGARDSQSSVEGVLGVNWHVYHLVGKTTSLSSQALLYPSFTESGRYRGTVDITLRKELVTDLNIDLTAYYDYDNKPPDASKTATSDHGIVTSLSYTF